MCRNLSGGDSFVKYVNVVRPTYRQLVTTTTSGPKSQPKSTTKVLMSSRSFPRRSEEERRRMIHTYASWSETGMCQPCIAHKLCLSYVHKGKKGWGERPRATTLTCSMWCGHVGRGGNVKGRLSPPSSKLTYPNVTVLAWLVRDPGRVHRRDPHDRSYGRSVGRSCQ